MQNKPKIPHARLEDGRSGRARHFWKYVWLGRAGLSPSEVQGTVAPNPGTIQCSENLLQVPQVLQSQQDIGLLPLRTKLLFLALGTKMVFLVVTGSILRTSFEF